MLLNSLQPPGQPPTTQPISGARAEKPCDRHLCLAPECQAKGQGPHSASETLPTSPLFPSPTVIFSYHSGFTVPHSCQDFACAVTAVRHSPARAPGAPAASPQGGSPFPPRTDGLFPSFS